jgi:hypothetical protein
MCFVAVVVATISRRMQLLLEALWQLVVIIHHRAVKDHKKEEAWVKFHDIEDIDLYIL